jgi:hypothetical protein
MLHAATHEPAEADFATFRQSKLSAEEITELQKATHFDKKELQQWYKGL